MSRTISHRDAESTGILNKGLRNSVSLWQKRILLWFFPFVFIITSFFLPLSRILSLTFNLVALTPENFRIAYDAVRFTFYQAILSTLLTLALGLPSAILFARYNFRGKSLLRVLTAIPFMLPTVVVAAGFNALLGPRGLIHLPFPPLSFLVRFLLFWSHIFFTIPPLSFALLALLSLASTPNSSRLPVPS